MMKYFISLIFSVAVVFCINANAYEGQTNLPKQSHETIKDLEGLNVVENLGHNLNLSREFVNESGETVKLGKYFDGHRPVLMSMVYYGCPSLCNYHLNGLLDTFKKLKTPVGSDFQVVVVSMDHSEGSELAAKKKANYIKALGQVGAENGFHFLVGNEENVKALANELGFKFRWNEEEKQFAHSAVAYVVTPTGMISRYLHGIMFDAKTLRLSLVEAANGKIGNVIEQLTLFCFQFNPTKNKYTFYAFNIMRVGAGITVVLLAAFLIPLWRRERNGRPKVAKGEA